MSKAPRLFQQKSILLCREDCFFVGANRAQPPTNKAIPYYHIFLDFLYKAICFGSFVLFNLIGSMGLVHLPTNYRTKSTKCDGKYTVRRSSHGSVMGIVAEVVRQILGILAHGN